MTLSESTLGNDVCTLYQSCSIFRGWTAYAWSWKLPIGQFLHHHWITMKYRACMILHFLDLVNEICCQKLILFSSFADAHRKGCWVRERAQAAIIICSVKGLSFMWLRTSKHHVPYCTIRLEHLPLDMPCPISSFSISFRSIRNKHASSDHIYIPPWHNPRKRLLILHGKRGSVSNSACNSRTSSQKGKFRLPI
jgi:hypothetical protein